MCVCVCVRERELRCHFLVPLVGKCSKACADLGCAVLLRPKHSKHLPATFPCKHLMRTVHTRYPGAVPHCRLLPSAEAHTGLAKCDDAKLGIVVEMRRHPHFAARQVAQLLGCKYHACSSRDDARASVCEACNTRWQKEAVLAITRRCVVTRQLGKAQRQRSTAQYSAVQQGAARANVLASQRDIALCFLRGREVEGRGVAALQRHGVDGAEVPHVLQPLRTELRTQ